MRPVAETEEKWCTLKIGRTATGRQECRGWHGRVGLSTISKRCSTPLRINSRSTLPVQSWLRCPVPLTGPVISTALHDNLLVSTILALARFRSEGILDRLANSLTARLSSRRHGTIGHTDLHRGASGEFELGSVRAPWYLAREEWAERAPVD